MLIKRVSPKELNPGDEVKYILTADIGEMAKIIGMSTDSLRHQLINICDKSGVPPFYGMSRPDDFFRSFNTYTDTDGWSVRKLSLSEVDVRVQDIIRMDASESFLIVPLVVTRPLFVGDLQASAEMRYELIPHIEVWEGGENNYDNGVPRRILYQYVNRPELHPTSVETHAWNSRIVGFDLVLLPNEPEPHVHSFSEPKKEMPELRKFMTQQSVQKCIDSTTNHDVVAYDYGFGVTAEYVYTSDMKDNLRIDHTVFYKGRKIFTHEDNTIVLPTDLLTRACKSLNLAGLKDTEFEAYEIMRVLRDTPDFAGISYRRS